MPSHRVQSVIYFGIYSKEAAFPRSNNQIQALRRQGVKVLEAHAELDASFRKRSRATRSISAALGFAMGLAASYALTSCKFLKTPAADALVVGHPGYFHIHLARLLRFLTRRRMPLVYDAFIPMHEALVEDRGMLRPGSLFSRLLHAFESACLHSADICLVDTESHKRYLAQEFDLDPERIKVARVGATIVSDYAEPAPARNERDFKVVFAGTLIPLQGVDVILEAAYLLREHAEISFCVVGSGQLEETMHELAARRGLSRVRFTGWLPTGQLGDVLRAHHLALGIFGTTPKAGRVIPSKVYDICAAGAAFVTADTPAIREVFTHLENAFLVPAGSPRHLADAILRLKSDPELRFRLAAAALKTGRAAFSQDRIGLQVLAAVTPEADDCRADRA